MVKIKELGATVTLFAKRAYDAIKRCVKWLWGIVRRPTDVTKLALVLSIFTLLLYNIPLIKMVVNGVDIDYNGVLITTTVVVLLIVLNYLLYYILLYCLRVVGKYIIAFTFIGNAICLYFINSYGTLITMEMMGNVFNTRTSEAGGFFSLTAIMYFIFLGLIPAILVVATRVKYRSIWRFLISLITTLIIVISSLFLNRSNILWIDSHASQIGGLAMPWSYTVNTIRYIDYWIMINRKAIPLPDASINTDTRDVVVLVIGESARRDHFSLYDYERTTNPLLEQEKDLIVIDATSADTYTTAGVKAILDHKPSEELYEILPNYLYRNGVDVIWRSSNWGEPPLKIEKYSTDADLAKRYGMSAEYNEVLIEGLAEEILASDKQKILFVIHTNTSHGPKYYSRYPYEFEEFTPVCTTVEMSKANRQELVNAYDNTILYTDYLLSCIIDELRTLPDEMRRCMIFISDHGESLGEGGMYMHGLPMRIAPKEQYIIPFIVWNSDPYTHVKDFNEVGQYHIFHSVMSYLGMTSPIFNEDMNIFWYEERSE